MSVSRPSADGPPPPPGERSRWLTLPALALLASGAVALVTPPLFTSRTFAVRDLVDFFYPMKRLLGEALRSGEVPWWVPYDYAGLPFFANLQSGVLYPPNWVHVVLPLEQAFPAYVAIHLVAAAWGAYALGRVWGLSQSASAAAGLSYSLGGLLVSAIELPNNLSTAAWIPGVAAASCRLAARPGRRGVALLAGLLALAILGGEPHLAALGFGASMVLLLATPARGGGRARLLSAGLAAGALLLATGLCAVQVLPFLRFASLSERVAGFSLEDASRYSLPPRQAAAFAEAPGGRHWLELGTGEGEQNYYRDLYAGGAALALAAAGLASAPRARAAALAALGALGLATALGTYGVLFPALHGSGLLASFRFPAKFLLLPAFSLAILAGLGVEAAAGRLRSATSRVSRLVAAGPPLAVAACTAALAAASPDRGFGAAALAAAFASTAVTAAAIFPVAARALPAVLAAGVGADLLLAHRNLLPTAKPASLYAPSAVHEFLARRDAESPERVYPRPASDARRQALFAAPLPLEQYLRLPVLLLDGSVPAVFGLSSLRGGAALHLRWNEEILDRIDRTGNRNLLRVAATRYFLSWAPVSDPGLVPLLREGPAHLYEVTGALPRAYVPKRWELREDPADFAERLDDEDVASGLVALFDAHPPGHPKPAGEPGSGTARVVGRSSGGVRVEARMSAPGLLVLVETWAPGWWSVAGGVERPALRVNGSFRGVFLDRGVQEVEFRYRPPGLRAGTVASLGSAALLAALLVQRRGGAGRA